MLLMEVGAQKASLKRAFEALEKPA